MTAYDLLVLVLSLGLIIAVWKRVLSVVYRAHRRGAERLAVYDAAIRRRELARSVGRHPSGFLPETTVYRNSGPRWLDVTHLVRTVRVTPGR